MATSDGTWIPLPIEPARGKIIEARQTGGGHVCAWEDHDSTVWKKFGSPGTDPADRVRWVDIVHQAVLNGWKLYYHDVFKPLEDLQASVVTQELLAAIGDYRYDIGAPVRVNILPPEPQPEVVVEALNAQDGMEAYWTHSVPLSGPGGWIPDAGYRIDTWREIVEMARRQKWQLVIREKGAPKLGRDELVNAVLRLMYPRSVTGSTASQTELDQALAQHPTADVLIEEAEQREVVAQAVIDTVRAETELESVPPPARPAVVLTEQQVVSENGIYVHTDGESYARRGYHPSRHDEVTAWLRARRESAGSGVERNVIDALLDDYKLHADTGTPLSEQAKEHPDE